MLADFLLNYTLIYARICRFFPLSFYLSLKILMILLPKMIIMKKELWLVLKYMHLYVEHRIVAMENAPLLVSSDMHLVAAWWNTHAWSEIGRQSAGKSLIMCAKCFWTHNMIGKVC